MSDGVSEKNTGIYLKLHTLKGKKKTVGGGKPKPGGIERNKWRGRIKETDIRGRRSNQQRGAGDEEM